MFIHYPTGPPSFDMDADFDAIILGHFNISSFARQALYSNIQFMKKYFTTIIGILRLTAFLEGFSLLILVFVAVPLKYLYNDHSLSQGLGPVHGAFFILYVLLALKVGHDQKWKFTATTWKVLLASFIPFGTFYIDFKILKKIEAERNKG